MSKVISFDDSYEPASDELYIDQLPNNLENIGQVEHIVLRWHERSRPRRRCRTDAGTKVILALPRGTVLSDGDLLYATAERSIRVKAELEDVLVIRPADCIQACRFAHHLGNWHRSIELEGDGTFVVEPDEPLIKWLKKANIEFVHTQRPFHPNLNGAVHEIVVAL